MTAAAIFVVVVVVEFCCRFVLPSGLNKTGMCSNSIKHVSSKPSCCCSCLVGWLVDWLVGVVVVVWGGGGGW